MKRNEMLQLILNTRTWNIHSHNTYNDSINEFHRLNGMEFMSIEWEIVTDVLAVLLFCFVFVTLLSVSHWASQCGVTVDIGIRNTQLWCQKCSTLYKQFGELFSPFNLWSIKSNAIMVSYEMDYSRSIAHKIGLAHSNYQHWKVYTRHIRTWLRKSGDGSSLAASGKSKHKECILQLHFCFCTVAKET